MSLRLPLCEWACVRCAQFDSLRVCVRARKCVRRLTVSLSLLPLSAPFSGVYKVWCCINARRFY